MNANQIQSLIRSILLALGAGLVTHGKIDQAGLEQAVGAVISLGAVIWSQLHHSANPPPPSA